MKMLRTIAIAAFAASALHAQDRVLRVTAADGQPISYAFVAANGGRAMLTDEDGRVSMGAGKKQTMTIEVRRIGFTPFFGKLDFPDTGVTMPIVLTAIAQQLGSVKVTADKSKNSLELNGFYRRWLDSQHGVTSAVFMGPEEIDKRNSSRLTALLSGVNGVNITRTTTGNSVAVSGAGGACPMAVIVDGRKVCPNGGCGNLDVSHGITDMNAVLLDQVLDVNSVAGIEVYKRGGNMPTDFHVDGECGAVAFWTGSRKH
jgi:hypothetical protein